MYEISDGWITQSCQVISPNYNERPQGTRIDCIVIHCISLPPGEYEGNDINALFTNQLDSNKHEFYQSIKGLKVSAHLLIRRSGELVQYVNLLSRAWHAGESRLGEQVNCNDFSIGIELEGTDDSEFEAVQYDVLIKVVKTLQAHFPDIKQDRIVGHSDIAPGRKTDPGSGFAWDAFFSRLNS